VSKPSKQEVETLLKKGAYAFFEGCAQPARSAPPPTGAPASRPARSEDRGAQFCAEDIDQILEKNARVLTFQSSSDPSTSTFAKATFQPTDERGAHRPPARPRARPASGPIAERLAGCAQT
jgi:hypothetical protein